ncbi:mitoguardin [Schistocerca gregaria]|uniref:mitoguardin n=1 Tax=Schistocerca gregaria TaxID=7010 RepID=UPI00211EEC0E|nr:mitoguardin [Schistocerca gregaria]
MSMLTQINPLLIKIPNIRFAAPFRNINLSVPQKITVVSVTVGVVLIGFLARYLRRRRRVINYNKRGANQRIYSSRGAKSPNGDAASVQSGRRSGSPGGARPLTRQGSVLSSDRGSLPASLGLGLPSASEAPAGLTPQQLGVMGMEALDTAVSYWEDALAAYTVERGGGGGPLALPSQEEAEFARELQQLLDAAYRLQADSETMFLDQRSVLFRTDSSARLYGESMTTYTSNPESFVSAQDEVADLREFEEFVDIFPDIGSLALYQSATKQFEESGIPYRSLRTEMVHCSSDVEYLCKLHCIRLAFQYLFRDPGVSRWFADTGRQVLTDLILFADRDPKEFLVAYESMLEFLHNESNWVEVEQELSLKGVKAMTFYDIVLDYILMDAFEDLDSPPSSVTAVVQNRWLSNGFKETALATAVWSILKAKRRILKFPYGFMAHFYAISEQVSPLMAWGYLGPDENLKEMCHAFKDHVVGFLVDIFSFQKSRFTTVEELAEDVLKYAKGRAESLSLKMSLQDQIGVDKLNMS